jgi:PHS family inorganic phosphate transporter-like MFS transporter
LIIFATVAQALSSDSPGMSIVGTIIFWRVLMGSEYCMQNIT